VKRTNLIRATPSEIDEIFIGYATGFFKNYVYFDFSVSPRGNE